MLYSSHVVQRHLCLSTSVPVKSSVFTLILVSSFLAPTWSVTRVLKFKLSFKMCLFYAAVLLLWRCKSHCSWNTLIYIFSWYCQCCVNVWYSHLIVVIVFSDSGSSFISKSHSKSSVLRTTTNLFQVFFDQLILWAIQAKGQPWKNERLQLSNAILISV